MSLDSTLAVPLFTSHDDRKCLDSQKFGLGLLPYIRGFLTFAGTLRALRGAGAMCLLSHDHHQCNESTTSQPENCLPFPYVQERVRSKYAMNPAFGYLDPTVQRSDTPLCSAALTDPRVRSASYPACSGPLSHPRINAGMKNSSGACRFASEFSQVPVSPFAPAENCFISNPKTVDRRH